MVECRIRVQKRVPGPSQAILRSRGQGLQWHSFSRFSLTRIVHFIGVVALLLTVSAGSVQARRERLSLRHEVLDLPGPPSKVIPSDLDGDGRQDLLVVLAYSLIEDQGVYSVEEMVQITTVIPLLLDRRELRAYRATADGHYVLAAKVDLLSSILHLEAGPPEMGVLALTDEGVARLRFDLAAESPLWFEPLIEDPPILAGTRSFYASLQLIQDLNGDGLADLLLPSQQGLSVYLGMQAGLSTVVASRLDVLREPERREDSVQTWYPWPEVRDINGDGIADLLFRGKFLERHAARRHVFLGSAEGRFRPLRDQALDCHDVLTDVRLAVAEEGKPWTDNVSLLRDLDGDGRAEAVRTVQVSRGDSLRKEIQDAKRPRYLYSFHRLDETLSIEPEPYFELEVTGYAMEGTPAEELASFWVEPFQDLDGDGLKDLVTLTLDFSVFQAVKILATKRISVGLEFHVYAQQPDGRFVEVPDLDLSERLKLDLNRFQVNRFGQFAGDFDGDGRRDFVHLGRGKVITVHRGQAGCRYAKKPDLSIQLEEEPLSIDLVGIEDLDGDGLSDIRITRPLHDDDPDLTDPVRLDLYLSGGGS